MQQTVSEKFILYLFGTIYISYVSYYLRTVIVKILKVYDNSQVTNAHHSFLKNRNVNRNRNSTQVGTSEAIRLLNINFIHTRKVYHDCMNHAKFKQWLAGLIDGDGCFLLNKKGYASLEITMDVRDERALQAIKNVYGGSIKLRSGVSALRYKLHHKEGLLSLINDVNGEIRNSVRLIQLNYICIKYNIALTSPIPLTSDNAWFSGFFDADGTIAINSSNWQLSISAGQKTSEILTPLVALFGGYVYIDRGGQGSFKWYLTKKEDILNIIEYFKIYPSRSAKNNRLHLVPKFYELKQMKSHLAATDSLATKVWDDFIKKWKIYE